LKSVPNDVPVNGEEIGAVTVATPVNGLMTYKLLALPTP